MKLPAALPALLALAALAPASASADDRPVEPPKRDCAFGLVTWCIADAERNDGAPPSRVRVEAYGGYKPFNSYYQDEIRACAKEGCRLAFAGPAFGVDAFYNISGNARSDDYTAVGLSVSYMPVLTGIDDNTTGFQGELGRVGPGRGTLGYVPIRIALRKPSFLYLIKSKYLVSAFGAGLAIPVASGAGATFTGADSVKISIGGRLGAELPLGDALRVGIATTWSVFWYGSTFGESSFASAYAANVAYLF